MYKIQYDMNLYQKEDIQIKLLKNPPTLTFDNHVFKQTAHKRQKQSLERIKKEIKKYGKYNENSKNVYINNLYEKTNYLTHLFMNLKAGIMIAL